MKCFIGIFVAVAVMLNSVSALPARIPNDDAEVIDVPRKSESGFPDFKGVVDTGSIDPFLIPEPHPFAVSLGLFDTFDDIFRRLHTRLWPLAVVGTDDTSDEGTGISFNVNPKNGNTTSTVKVVDGHKIEINDTVYGDDKSVFKVRVVNIRPLDSDEDVDQETTTTVAVGRGSAVTSAPTSSEDNEDSAEERREPLENKEPIDNEIKGNIDEPEIAVAIEMLPTTAIVVEADVANFNDDKFVTDNTLESGSAEAETNMADEANRTTMRSVDEEQEEAALAAAELSNKKEQEKEDEDEEDGVDGEEKRNRSNNDSLTAEDNNEDQIEAETSDNFNESKDEADAGVLDADELTAEVSEDTDKDIDAVGAEFDTESISITHKRRNEGADEDVEGADSDRDETVAEAEEVEGGDMTNMEFDEAKKSSGKPLKYAVLNKTRQREDFSSSDDEAPTDLAPMKMSDQFDTEWGDLAEANDLSNDIDIYDSIPPVDLSNDLAVNDIAASQPGFTLNPDAEFVDLEGGAADGALMSSASMGPKFEKLSLGGAAINRMSYHQPSSSLPHHSQNFK